MVPKQFLQRKKYVVFIEDLSDVATIFTDGL
jgi:hypothetical protein